MTQSGAVAECNRLLSELDDLEGELTEIRKHIIDEENHGFYGNNVTEMRENSKRASSESRKDELDMIAKVESCKRWLKFWELRIEKDV